jgi:iron complex outermembrane receptor protein
LNNYFLQLLLYGLEIESSGGGNIMTVRTHRWLLAATALAGLAAEMPVQAQVLEEIVVTARKREESLQDIPMSITALTAADIKERGITDLFSLSQYTPGFYMEQTGNRRANPTFRGLVLNTNIEERQNSSVFVDGFFVSGSAGTFGFNDIARVEVLKGPQSALFGRATFGGAVNFITKLPGDEFEAEVDATVARFDEAEIAATVMGPVSDSVGIKLSGRVYNFGGQWKNLNDGATIGDLRSQALSGTVVVRPSDDLQLIFRGAYGQDNDGVAPSYILPASTNNCLFYSVLPAQDGYTCGKIGDVKAIRHDSAQTAARFNKGVGLDQNTYRWSAEAIWSPGEWDVNVRAAYNKQYALVTSDASLAGPIGAGTPNGRGGPLGTLGLNFGGRLGIIHLNQGDSDFRDKAFEARISSPGDADVYGFLGVSWFEQDILRSNRRQDAARTLPMQLDNDSDNKNYSIFGNINWQATEQWRFGADGRWQADTVEEMTGPVLMAAVPRVSAAAALAPISKGKVRFKTFLPRVIVDFRPDDDKTLYALASRGNKPGFFNNAAIAALIGRPAVVDEEFVWNYEVGAKTTNLDGRLVINVAAYYLDWSNQQVRQTFIDAQGQASTIATNAGQTEGWGFELESTYAMSENFILNSSLARTKAEYKQFDEDTFTAQLGIPVSQTGNQTPRFPNWTVSVGGTYTQPAFGDWSYMLRNDIALTGKRWDDIYNLAYLGWEYKWNAKLGLANDNWKVSLFVDNILDDNIPSGLIRFRDIGRQTLFRADRRTPAQIQADTRANRPPTPNFDFPYSTQVQLGDRRKFGINVTYKY